MPSPKLTREIVKELVEGNKLGFFDRPRKDHVTLNTGQVFELTFQKPSGRGGGLFLSPRSSFRDYLRTALPDVFDEAVDGEGDLSGMTPEEAENRLTNANFWKARIRRGVDPERVARAVSRAAERVAEEQAEARRDEFRKKARDLQASRGLDGKELLDLLMS